MPTWVAWVVLVWAVAATALALLVSRSLHAIDAWDADGETGGTRRPGTHEGGGVAAAGPRVGIDPRG